MRPKTYLRQIVNRMVNQQVWPHDHVTCAFDGLSRDVQNLEDGTGGKVIAQMENFASITIDDFFSVCRSFGLFRSKYIQTQLLYELLGSCCEKPNFFVGW